MAIPSMREMWICGPFNLGASHMPIAIPKPTEPMLKKVDAIAGTPNLFDEFSIPIACAANATSRRNGNMMRVMVTANSYFPGTAA